MRVSGPKMHQMTSMINGSKRDSKSMKISLMSSMRIVKFSCQCLLGAGANMQLGNRDFPTLNISKMRLISTECRLICINYFLKSVSGRVTNSRGDLDKSKKISIAQAYAHFKTWYEINYPKSKPPNRQDFEREMRMKGWEHSGNSYLGIEIKGNGAMVEDYLKTKNTKNTKKGKSRRDR